MWIRCRDHQPRPGPRRTGDRAQAHHAYQIAIGLERDDAVRRFLQARAAAL
jgi:RNA polymerase sigma-70 factor (ECF subfamily)